jgi:tetratricopeptide (TPR) repeat protein
MERSCEILEKYYLLGENDIEDKGATFSDIRGQYADALTKIGTIQYQLSFYQEAQKSVERCLAIQEEWYSSDHPEISGTLRVLSRWHLERGDYKLAKPLVVRAITIDENYYGRNHSLTAISLSMLASILKNEKKLQESIDLYKEAIEILNGTLGKGHRTTSIVLGHLASCYRAKGEGSNAIKFLRKSFKSISLEVSRNLPLMTGAERFQYLDMQRGPEPLLLNLVALQGNGPKREE